jgi:hypothetical protein
MGFYQGQHTPTKTGSLRGPDDLKTGDSTYREAASRKAERFSRPDGAAGRAGEAFTNIFRPLLKMVGVIISAEKAKAVSRTSCPAGSAPRFASSGFSEGYVGSFSCFSVANPLSSTPHRGRPPLVRLSETTIFSSCFFRHVPPIELPPILSSKQCATQIHTANGSLCSKYNSMATSGACLTPSATQDTLTINSSPPFPIPLELHRSVMACDHVRERTICPVHCPDGPKCRVL